MRLQDFDEDDGRRVWLSQGEIELFLSKAKRAEQTAAFTLGAQSGLRRSEITSVTPADFFNAPEGWLRIPPEYTKSDRYRETPIPSGFELLVDGMDPEPDEPVVGVTGHSVWRWVRNAALECWSDTGDTGWEYLTPHDLRRTWGGHLLWDKGVLPAVVMNWGGWNDWQTFRDHYLGEMSPAAAERERSKVFDDTGGRDPVFEPTVEGVV